MMQYVIIAGLIAFIYFFYFKKKPEQKVSKESSSRDKKEDANEMIECAQCGVYSELSDAILSNGKYYCSNECIEEAR